MNSNTKDIFHNKSIDNLSSEELALLYKEYDKFNQNVYDFVLTYYDYIYREKDYGTGDKLKMVEVHIVSDIADTPDITAQDLAKKWDRTPAFISKTLRHLEDLGYIEQEINEDNRRFNIISLSEKGKKLDLAHKKYDIKSITNTNNALLEFFTIDEIIKFRKFLVKYGKLISEE